MRTAVDIYAEYRIAPWLQLHQLRVAAVAKVLSLKLGVGDEAVLAGLFHDMANVLKFDLSPKRPVEFKPLITDDMLDFWREEQRDFREKYGADEHAANEKIAREIGLAEPVCALIRDIGFSKMGAILHDERVVLHIIEYADQRVGPFGVLSIDERLEDGQKRYKGRYGELGRSPEDEARREECVVALREIERGLLARAGMRAEDITDTSIAPIIEELKRYEIS